MQSRNDNMTSELVKTLADLHVCTDASGHIDEIGMWLDCKDKNWMLIHFHDIDHGEVNGLPGLIYRLSMVQFGAGLGTFDPNLNLQNRFGLAVCKTSN